MKQLRNLLLMLITSIMLLSCSSTIYITNKEFVVKQIDGTKSETTCDYVLFNKKNKAFVLKDVSNKYQIGDTLMLIRK